MNDDYSITETALAAKVGESLIDVLEDQIEDSEIVDAVFECVLCRKQLELEDNIVEFGVCEECLLEEI